MDVGTTLRTARERSGLTVNELASRTRITVPLLQAIEDNAFDRVPGGIFVRGFIRSYAREVGLDPEDSVSQFLEETGGALPDAGPSYEAPLDDEIRVVPIDPEPSTGRATWGYALIVAALAVAFVSSQRNGGSSESIVSVPRPEEPVAAATLASTTTEPDAVATTGNGLLRFDIAPSGPCWVEAVVDGKRVVYRMMQQGDRETISAREIALRVGDPAAFAYTINGRPGRPLGPAGTPISVRLTNESYQAFVTG